MESRPSFFRPDVARYLLTDEGEFIVDEVVKHPVCMIWPCLITAAGIAVMLSSALLTRLWPPILIIGLALSCVGLWKFHEISMDRFVITNMRVYRVNGIINRHVATMPLTRILDISVYQPLLGILLNYGHFTFESAADDQGLRRVTYVASPKERDLTIQRVIQRAGIRAVAKSEDDGS